MKVSETKLWIFIIAQFFGNEKKASDPDCFQKAEKWTFVPKLRLESLVLVSEWYNNINKLLFCISFLFGSFHKMIILIFGDLNLKLVRPHSPSHKLPVWGILAMSAQVCKMGFSWKTHYLVQWVQGEKIRENVIYSVTWPTHFGWKLCASDETTACKEAYAPVVMYCKTYT